MSKRIITKVEANLGQIRPSFYPYFGDENGTSMDDYFLVERRKYGGDRTMLFLERSRASNQLLHARNDFLHRENSTVNHLPQISPITNR